MQRNNLKIFANHVGIFLRNSYSQTSSMSFATIIFLPQPTSFVENLLKFKTSRILVAVSLAKHCTYCRRLWRLETISNVLYILLCKCICAIKSMRAAVEKLQKNSSFQTVSLNFSTFAIKRIKTMFVCKYSQVKFIALGNVNYCSTCLCEIKYISM